MSRLREFHRNICAKEKFTSLTLDHPDGVLNDFISLETIKGLTFVVVTGSAGNLQINSL